MFTEMSLKSWVLDLCEDLQKLLFVGNMISAVYIFGCESERFYTRNCRSPTLRHLVTKDSLDVFI